MSLCVCVFVSAFVCMCLFMYSVGIVIQQYRHSQHSQPHLVVGQLCNCSRYAIKHKTPALLYMYVLGVGELLLRSNFWDGVSLFSTEKVSNFPMIPKLEMILQTIFQKYLQFSLFRSASSSRNLSCERRKLRSNRRKKFQIAIN